MRLSDEAVLAHIKAAHAGSKGEYGWPRIWKELISRGVRVGKDRIQKLMKRHGVKARGKRRAGSAQASAKERRACGVCSGSCGSR